MFPERGGLPNEIWEKIIQKVAGASAVKMEDISSLAALRATCIDFKYVVDNKTALWIGVPTKSPTFNLKKVGYINLRNKFVKIASIESFDSGAILDVGKIHSRCENGAQKLVRAVLDDRLDICKLVLNRLKDKNPIGTYGSDFFVTERPCHISKSKYLSAQDQVELFCSSLFLPPIHASVEFHKMLL